MTEAQRDALRALLRRADEVRGLADDGPGLPTATAADDPDALVHTLRDLIAELERSHRRLIETNVQLVSLREVGARLAAGTDAAETTRTIARYLQRAHGFDHVALLLLAPQAGELQGAWADPGAGHPHSIEVPVVGRGGALSRLVWTGRSVHVRDCRLHPPIEVDGRHPLAATFAELGTMVAVPLRRGNSEEAAGPCRAHCPLGRAAWLVPPPDADPAAWRAAREDHQERCLQCEHQSLLGVLAVARGKDRPALSSADLAHVESIGLSLAPMVENARLLQDLRRSERFRLHVVDSMASALVATNLDGEVLSFNRAAEELLGWTEAEVAARPVGDVLGDEAEPVVRRTLSLGRGAHGHETFVRTRAGEALPVRMSTSPLRDDDGHVYGAIATFLDLTPIRRAEERARQLDRLAALGRFTSSVAHEIRNPLTGIGAGVQYLARVLPEDVSARRHLDFILDEIRRLDRIVQELFDVTHPRRLDLRPRALGETLARAAQSLEALYAQRRITLELVVAPALPPVPHDADQIQQVFINLLKNAAEASEPGGRVEASLGAGEGPHARDAVVARVSDHGRGIEPDTLKTLFEPFVTTKPGGTGLGLYISHDIIKRHGGSLTAHSEPGRGATFAIELPLEIQGGVS